MTGVCFQNPFTDNAELQQRSARMLSMNTWDVTVALTNFDWSVFSAIHEVRPARKQLPFTIMGCQSISALLRQRKREGNVIGNGSVR